ncbi:MAG: purine-binding chemotaxis protein CheW [Planctomycetales bacterium]|nr:purine-binding chemotaxis protein CheW [Planctomycetales bacterium]
MTAAAEPTVETKRQSRDATGTIQLVSFRLGNEEYGIEITRVQEIILLGDITRIPESPQYIKGLINLRNTVIPIVDLRLRFGMPEVAPTEETRIMVVSISGKTVGFVVDGVNEVMRIPADGIVPPPPSVTGLGHDYLTGLVNSDERLLIVLDIERILGADESATLAAVAE